MFGSGYNVEEQWTLYKMHNYTPLHIQLGWATTQLSLKKKSFEGWIEILCDIISQNRRIFQVEEHFEIILAIFSFTNKETEVKSLDLPCSHAGFMSQS